MYRFFLRKIKPCLYSIFSSNKPKNTKRHPKSIKCKVMESGEVQLHITCFKHLIPYSKCDNL
ncbi:hypothetical protein DKX15_10695 [Enterococcus faecium]|nr:hypothetical protein DKX15_10695 [Enterococcus faecium]RAX30156.1 hypothetical protein DQE80_10885 [Enterococcus sp. HPCN18]